MNMTTQKINDIVPNEKTVDDLVEKLGLNRKLVELLVLRGYDNVDAINVFLHPDPQMFYDPRTMLGMNECCERIEQAIENQEKIVVYGDYDADGICAASILSLYLSSRGIDVYTHIPDRIGEGYGLSVESVERIIENATPDLIVTCDCGISAIEEVELAKDLGVDIVITDHHEVGDKLPDCVVVNPHQHDCKYPFKDLCGAGVALKIVQALGGIDAASEYYDLAAIATVADLVKMTDENRLIVQLGLRQMSRSRNFGVVALVDELKLKTVTSTDVAFKIAPRINAAGRMGSAYRAFELFTSNDPLIVAKRLQEIIEANNERKALCDELYSQAVSLLRGEDLITRRAIIITNDKWEKGITGILAARLVGEFKRPVFILVKNNDEYKGTCRSIDGINIYELLSHNADLLKEFGGHNQAAGFTILPSHIEEFKNRIYAELDRSDIHLFIPTVKYDLELSEQDVTKDLALALDLLEPTGNNGNPRPLFMTRSASLSATPLKANPNHTLLKTSGGMQLFAYNSYQLNTYYNGDAERELVYELSDGGYAPRLYLRGCAVEKLSVNDVLAKGGYLRMLNYPHADNVKYNEYEDDELSELIDNKFGILIIAGSKSTYERIAALNCDNIVLHEIFAETATNVYTRLMVAPDLNKDFMLENYRKVIFVDYPPSMNVVGYINRRTDAEVYLPKTDNRAQLFNGVNADRRVFGEYYNAIRANADIKASNVFSYFKALHSRMRTIELPQFIACLSVFTQLKLVSFIPDKGVAVKHDRCALDNSEIYKTIQAWQK